MNGDTFDRVDYARFLRLCGNLGESEFVGFVLKPNGVYVQIGSAPGLSNEERATLSWHPTGNHDDPALALPCSLDALLRFVDEAGLAGIVNERELENLRKSASEWPREVPTSQSNAVAAPEQVGGSGWASARSAKKSEPAESRAPAVSNARHDATEANEPPPLKRANLIKELEAMWPTIDADLREASRNGLDRARIHGEKGYWNKDAAIAWAEKNYRVKILTDNTMANLPRRVHTTK